jgi:hypothetical protein
LVCCSCENISHQENSITSRWYFGIIGIILFGSLWWSCLFQSNPDASLVCFLMIFHTFDLKFRFFFITYLKPKKKHSATWQYFVVIGIYYGVLYDHTVRLSKMPQKFNAMQSVLSQHGTDENKADKQIHYIDKQNNVNISAIQSDSFKTD